MIRRYLEKNPNELFWKFWLFVPYIIWMYSIGIELNKNTKISPRLNKVLLISLSGYIFTYLPIGIIILLSGFGTISSIFPYHLLAMGCIFLLMILTSLTIRRFEITEGLKPSNGLVTFLEIWCFVFGIWHIQPKLNTYVKRVNNIS